MGKHDRELGIIEAEDVKRAEAAGLSGDEAVMVAFEDNKNDAARVSGN